MKIKIFVVLICTLLICTSILSLSGAKTVQKKTNNVDLSLKTYTKETLNDGTSPDWGPLGFIPLPDTIESIPLTENGVNLLGNPPTSFDWRNYNVLDWTTIAKNQGGCGSCWDFSAHSTLEAIINIVEGDASLNLDLSEQYILSCYSGGWGCGGSNAYWAYKYMADNGGAIPESCFTYTADDTTPCSNKCSDWQEKRVPIVTYGSTWNPGRVAMQNKLVNDGPFDVDFSCYADFYTGSPSFDANGVYKYDGVSALRGGHQVSAVGYVDTPGNPNYDGYWICKNSWGSTWGPWGNGFFGIAYGEVGIDENIVWVSYSSTAPDTFILTGPSGLIDYDDVTFEWIGSDGTTPVSGLVYSYMLQGYDPSWSTWSSATSTVYSNLPDGSYTFKVKAKDKSGIPDYTPAERSFTILTPDQQQIRDYWHAGCYDNHWLGQSFKPTLSTLTHVKLYMMKSGAPPNDVVLSVRSSPSGSPLTSISKPAAAIPISWDWVWFDIPDITVTPENTYYLTLHTFGGTIHNCYIWSYGLVTPYTRGELWRSNSYGMWGSWLKFVWYDFCFKTFGN